MDEAQILFDSLAYSSQRDRTMSLDKIMSHFKGPHLTSSPYPDPEPTMFDALADNQSFLSHDLYPNELTPLEDRSPLAPDLPHNSPIALGKHRNLTLMTDILVIKTAEYIQFVGQVELRLAVCLEQLARSLNLLGSILEASSSEPLARTKGKMERLRKPILNRLRDPDWRGRDLTARTERWNNFLCWGCNNYRATITKERKDCNEVSIRSKHS
jgi:hypothetical protein